MTKELENWFKAIKQKQLNIVTHDNFDCVAEKLSLAQMSVLRIIGKAETYKDISTGIPVESMLADIKKRVAKGR